MQKQITASETSSNSNRTQQGIIGFLCLSFFPLVYFIGKMVVSLI
ncbi:hypothetical protein [Flavilitoribacter nigricans]|nr:hypothetical protein [Flavilitoribacter nigricans]